MLAALGNDAGRERLARARTDEDLASLRDDPTFRSLTGYVPVEVAWSPGTSSERAAQDIAARLHGAGVPARASGKAWRKDVEHDLLYVLETEEAAAAMADTIVAALDPSLKRVASSYLVESRPIVLVLAGDAIAAAGGDDGDVSAWVGARLHARREGAVEHLHLKRTGFFRWEQVEDGGRRIERTGRYLLKEDTLDLDYRQVIETPSADGGPPAVEVEQGRRSSHPIVAADGALRVDGVSFQRSR